MELKFHKLEQNYQIKTQELETFKDQEYAQNKQMILTL